MCVGVVCFEKSSKVQAEIEDLRTNYSNLHIICKAWLIGHCAQNKSSPLISNPLHYVSLTHTHTHTFDPFLRSKILVLIKPRKLIFQWGQLGKANSPSPVRLLKSYWSPWLHVKMDTYELGQNTNKLDSLSLPLPCSLSLCPSLFLALLQVCCRWLLATLSLKTHSLPFPSGCYAHKCLVGIWFTIVKG